jgi:phage-related minor tail protein
MDEVDRMVIGVRADTSGFARDVATLRTTLEGTMGDAATRAALSIERSLLRAVKTGKLGFEDLKASALAALDQIARAALTKGIGAVVGGGGKASGVAQLLGALIGLPGRATGGPVSPGQAYRVGERGPETFVPTTSGRIEAGPAGGRDVRVAITVRTEAGAAPEALQRSSRQVARAVRAALAE